MKILVPTDFSPDSQKALQYAIAVAKVLQRDEAKPEDADHELLILHVYHVPIGGDAIFFVTSPMLEREEQTTKDKLAQLVATVPEIQSVPHRILTKLSMPYEGIKETIEEEDIELVVMGVRGTNDTGIWLGSTTLQFMQYGVCPVLAVPRTTEVFHPQYIALATDLESSDDTAYLDFFKKLVQLWRARVDILHVHPNPSQVRVDQAQQALQLDHFLEGISHSYHFIEDKLPARGIEQHLIRSPTHLLVIVPRYHVAIERLFHKSITKQLVAHARLPILSVHEK